MDSGHQDYGTASRPWKREQGMLKSKNKKHRKHWEKALKMHEFSAMPPEESDQPMFEEKKTFLELVLDF